MAVGNVRGRAPNTQGFDHRPVRVDGVEPGATGAEELTNGTVPWWRTVRSSSVVRTPVAFAVLVARLVLAAVLAVAAVGKLRDLDGTRTAVIDLGVPSRVSGLVTAALPLAEISAAVALLLPLRAVMLAGAALALVLLAAFTVVIGRTLAAGRRPPCHCFGARSNTPLGPDAIVRNAALAALALVVLFG